MVHDSFGILSNYRSTSKQYYELIYAMISTPTDEIRSYKEVLYRKFLIDGDDPATIIQSPVAEQGRTKTVNLGRAVRIAIVSGTRVQRMKSCLYVRGPSVIGKLKKGRW
jgi:hypothetical protein